jgi:predicted ATP-grasp superfamily ATP-dependent carboligase
MGHSMKKERVVEPVWVYSHFMTNILLIFQDRIIDASKTDEFFRQYSQLVEEHQIPPDFIFNLDETYLNVGADSSKVVSRDEAAQAIQAEMQQVVGKAV